MNEDFIHSLLIATALVLIIEGIMPFLNPTMFKRALLQTVSMSDRQVRLIGLISMFTGLIFLYWIN
ncbi:MAG TPA: DUF2065 domain-containing protein [Methylophaga aminisulfidivorans]|uniref:DUF2065 domain-containing protein n=1 Tax=Methylophaga TaxID=40222 RepID=UPI00175A0AA9|nr:MULTISPECIES: DUF2065 domain-containing protein [Methylophaga]HIC47333.1 DUF2065 domain-containing protein [Methylophaga sp.]HIM39109.1 DUF2065 domain-containing protein [Methylophaga aminisulfidivorans]